MATSDARRFLESMLLAVRQAGAVSLFLQGEVQARQKERPGARSPEAAAVSVTDLAAQEVLLLALHETSPHAALDTEEETEGVALFPPPAPHRPLAVFDPLDGSFNYLAGSADFAVMAAWIEDGHYRAAVVAFPAWEEILWGLEGEGVWRQGPVGRPERVQLPRYRPPQLLVPPDLPEDLLAAFARGGLEAVASRCSAVDSTAVVGGRGRASWLPGVPDRRHAIGYFLAHLAGAAVRVDGRPWRGEDPGPSPAGGPSLTAADAPTLATLLEATGAVGGGISGGPSQTLF
jgi:fructose-1,6-bisphosphatase/inositol monophosphatase family enzyme